MRLEPRANRGTDRAAPWRLPAALPEAVVLLAVAPLVALVWWSLIGTPIRTFSIDLYPTWIAGRLWWDGHREAIYHPAIWVGAANAHPLWLAALESAGLDNLETSFVYPLPYLWITAPLSHALSLDAFAAVFLLANAVSALVVGAESVRLAGVVQPGRRLLGGLFAAASFPAMSGVGLGQNALPAAALVLIAFRLILRPDRLARTAGVGLLLLAAAVKPWCVLAIGLLVLLGQLRTFALAAAAWLAVFVLAPRLISPALADAYAAVVARLAEISLVTSNNASLRSLLHRLSWTEWPSAVANWSPLEVSPGVRIVETALIATAAVGFGALVVWRRPPPHRVLAAGLGLLLLPLGICWTHYFVFAIPVAFVAALDRELPTASRVLGFALLVLLLVPWHPLMFRAPVSPEQVALAPNRYVLWYALPILLTQAALFSALAPRPARDPAPS